MGHIHKYDCFRVNEARFTLSPALRELISGIDLGMAR